MSPLYDINIVKRLIRKCTRYMKNGVTTENACELFETTSSINEEESVVLTYIEDNADECFSSDSFLDLSPENVLTLVRSEFLSIQVRICTCSSDVGI
jgi:hypothetical protein